ncbi:tetratricopeptide repeat protein [Acaryochloris marina]|uniref:tetratricopeptide repeat protein n=1 Tax=Acaryochloris marina TaxID=155978 RepID=UPI002017D990|nr:tetratricopeptide repeat protein [Acaryochloris marina]
MVEGPKEQSEQGKFNLPSLHARVDDQMSSLIKRGLNLANEIEEDLVNSGSEVEVQDNPQQQDQEPAGYQRSEQPESPFPPDPLEGLTLVQPTVTSQPTLNSEEMDETSWAVVWLRRGLHKYEQADYMGAKDNFKQAIHKQPTLAAAHNGLGSVLYQFRDFVEAVVVYSQALDYAPENAELYCNLASALYRIQNYDEAALAYQKAIHYNAYLHAAYYGLGLAQFQIGFQEEAMTAFEQATQLNIRHAESFLGLAVTHFEFGEYQEASVALEQAMQLNPVYIEAYFRLQDFVNE